MQAFDARGRSVPAVAVVLCLSVLIGCSGVGTQPLAQANPPVSNPVVGPNPSGSGPGQTPSPPVQHSATLTWHPSAAPVDGYLVYRSTRSGGPYSPVITVPILATLYIDTNVTAGATYYYVVTAVAGGLESIYSNETRATIPTP